MSASNFEIESALSAQVTGARVKNSMSKHIHYTDEPLAMQLVPDFLSSPQELALKNQQTQVTISLSSGCLLQTNGEKASYAIPEDDPPTAR